MKTENEILEKVKKKYVGSKKPITTKTYKEIVDVSGGKTAYIVWIVSNLVSENIHSTDVYKFKNFFDIYKRYQSHFPIKDIGKIKTKEDVDTFISKCIEIIEKDVVVSKSEDQKFVHLNDIKKLEDVGIIYHGICENLQVFEIPNKLKGNREAFNLYKNILGRCSGRDKGAVINICTMSSFDHFNNYLKSYPNSSYFVLYNEADPKSPYQLHFESKQYMDKNDRALI